MCIDQTKRTPGQSGSHGGRLNVNNTKRIFIIITISTIFKGSNFSLLKCGIYFHTSEIKKKEIMLRHNKVSNVCIVIYANKIHDI